MYEPVSSDLGHINARKQKPMRSLQYDNELYNDVISSKRQDIIWPDQHLRTLPYGRMFSTT